MHLCMMRCKLATLHWNVQSFYSCTQLGKLPFHVTPAASLVSAPWLGVLHRCCLCPLTHAHDLPQVKSANSHSVCTGTESWVLMSSQFTELQELTYSC